jgi:hypothetical protein
MFRIMNTCSNNNILRVCHCFRNGDAPMIFIKGRALADESTVQL